MMYTCISHILPCVKLVLELRTGARFTTCANTRLNAGYFHFQFISRAGQVCYRIAIFRSAHFFPLCIVHAVWHFLFLASFSCIVLPHFCRLLLLFTFVDFLRVCLCTRAHVCIQLNAWLWCIVSLHMKTCVACLWKY